MTDGTPGRTLSDSGDPAVTLVLEPLRESWNMTPLTVDVDGTGYLVKEALPSPAGTRTYLVGGEFAGAPLCAMRITDTVDDCPDDPVFVDCVRRVLTLAQQVQV